MDLRDLQGEESFHQLPVCPRKRYLDPVGAFLEILHQRLDSLSNTEAFPGRLLAPGEEALDPAEADNQIGTFVALHHTGDQLANLVLIFFKDPVSFSFPDLLEHDLFT